MSRPVTTYEAVERGIRRVTKTYDDGRVVRKHQIKYADAQGRIVTKTVDGSLTQARAVRSKYVTEVAAGEHVVVSKRDSNVTFKAVAEHWFHHASHLRASTRQGLRTIIAGRLQPLHDVRMKGLNYSIAQEFQTSLSHLAPTTQRQTMRLVNVICRDAVRRGLLKSNPCAQLNRIKTRRARVSIPSEKQVEALIKRLRSPEPFASQEKTPEGRAKLDRRPDKRWSLLVEASAFSGLRAGELAGLQVRDIDFDNYTLTVARAVSIASRDVDAPKTEAALRDVDCLEPGLCKRLKKHVRGMRATDYVFGEIMADGVSRPYNHMNFYRRHFQPACEDLGVTTRFHDLRHFYASILIAEGEDLMNVARLLGHTSPGFTLSTYGHLIKRDNNGRGERQAARRAAARGEKRKEPKRPKGPKPGKRPF